MTSLDPILPAFTPNQLQFFIEDGKKRGVVRGNNDAWKTLRKHIIESKQIPDRDINEFTIHLRILADHFLIFATGERSLPSFITQCLEVQESHRDTLKQIKALRKRIELGNLKNTLPDAGAALISALDGAVSPINEAINRIYIPASDRNPVRRSNHALVQTFEAIWNLYANKPIKGNKKAFAVAREFFTCAGYIPRGGKSGELAFVAGAFKAARQKTEHLGPLTAVRRMTTEEKRVFVIFAF